MYIRIKLINIFTILFQSLGNHELDNGVSGLTPLIEKLKCPVLACNLNLANEPLLAAKGNLMKSVVFNINGIKIAVIGYLTPETEFLVISNNVEYMEEIDGIKKEIARLKKDNINIFIALGHSGFTKDIEIAKAVEDIDLVIGGHTNTFLWNGNSPDVEKPEGAYPTLVMQKSGRMVAVVQAYAYTKYLGKLHMTFDASGEVISFNGNPILLDNSIAQDKEVSEIVDRYRYDIIKVTELIVGQTSILLDAQTCHIKECNIGNMITDAVVHKYASEYNGKGWTDAPIAIINGGSIKASVGFTNSHANITKGDLITALPFSGNIVKLSVNGSIVLQMLEHAVENYNPLDTSGSFLQFSGLKVELDLRFPIGKRVVNVNILCGECVMPEYTDLDVRKEYKILMSAFLSMGRNGYNMLHGLPAVPLSFTDLDSVIEYVSKQSPIYIGLEGRIIIHNANQSRNSAAFSKLPSRQALKNKINATNL